MDPIIYIQLLNHPELEVEYQIRNLSSKTVDGKELLVRTLRAEQLDKNLVRRETHAKANPSLEIEECRNRYNELIKATEEQGSSPPLDFVTLCYVKSMHYKERIFRLISTFGENPEFTRAYRNWRHVFNNYHTLWSELQNPEIQDKSPQREEHTESSFADRLDHLISKSLLDTNQTSPQVPNSPKHQTNVKLHHVNKENIKAIPETTNLNRSVADFFYKAGSGYTNNLEEQLPLRANIPLNCYDPIRSPNLRKYNLNSTNSNQNMHNLHIGEKLQGTPQFRLDNFYKISQKWKLSFDGSENLNVHDFIYRLEQMAGDDGFPKECLTKVLYMFLSKKAEDWYWVYKADHPVSSWENMKSAIISYFSSSNYEEEMKEQIIRRFQGNRESFSDFSLSIQKMNARLQSRLSEHQIIYRLCQNMYPALKNVTLPYHNQIQTVEQLRILCRDYERLWEQSGYDPRRFGDTQFKRRQPINELHMQMQDLQIKNHEQSSNNQTNANVQPDSQEKNIVEAFQRKINDREDGGKGTLNTNNYICWNCHDIGHRYQDCNKPFLNVFCFGCGAKNVRKPSCQKCISFQKGNVQPSANYVRGSRLGVTPNQTAEER